MDIIQHSMHASNFMQGRTAHTPEVIIECWYHSRTAVFRENWLNKSCSEGAANLNYRIVDGFCNICRFGEVLVVQLSSAQTWLVRTWLVRRENLRTRTRTLISRANKSPWLLECNRSLILTVNNVRKLIRGSLLLLPCFFLSKSSIKVFQSPLVQACEAPPTPFTASTINGELQKLQCYWFRSCL